MSMVVHPDEIIGAGAFPAWDEEGCPNCDALPDAGPEGGAWCRLHCWKCGFNPALSTVNAPSSIQTRAQWGEFQRMVQEAVAAAYNSPAQLNAEALARQLGPQGLLDLARQEQERLGFVQPTEPPAGT